MWISQKYTIFSPLSFLPTPPSHSLLWVITENPFAPMGIPAGHSFHMVVYKYVSKLLPLNLSPPSFLTMFTNLFFTSMSLFSPANRFIYVHFSTFHICITIYNIPQTYFTLFNEREPYFLNTVLEEHQGKKRQEEREKATTRELKRNERDGALHNNVSIIMWESAYQIKIKMSGYKVLSLQWDRRMFDIMKPCFFTQILSTVWNIIQSQHSVSE